MPYRSEHAARLRRPGGYERFRRTNDQFGAGVHAIWGITGGGGVELQAIRFDAERFTTGRARAWLRERGYRPILFEPATKRTEAVMDEFLLIEAAQSEHPRVMGLAYSGGKMNLPGWRYPVVVDLSGLRIPEQVPLLLDHRNQTTARVGMVAARLEADGLVIEGEVTSTGGPARGIVEQARAGADWQLSIGAEVKDAELVRGKRTVNDREHAGPFYHVKASVLREVSVVAVGADGGTRMKIAASFHLSGAPEVWAESRSAGEAGAQPERTRADGTSVRASQGGEDGMDGFAEWLQKHGIQAEGLGEDRRSALRAAFEAGKEPPAQAPAAAKGGEPEVPGEPAEDPAERTARLQTEAREEAQSAIRAERERVSAIQEICAGEFPQIEREAVKAGWSVEDTSQKVLKAMRENRPQADVQISVGRGSERDCDAETLEAACVLATGISRPEDHFGEQTLDRASRRFRGGIGLQELILEAAWANGYPERTFRESREALRYAFAPDVRAAGVSSVNIGGILSNVANKFLLEGFNSVERTWRNICAVRNVTDFKTVTSYRLVGKDQYEQVAPGGEIKHGTLGEESFTNKADTYGLMLSIDRRDIINDDLGAITLVPRKLGRGSGLKINDIFWSTFLGSADFFTAANKNLLTGANTALGIDGLTKAETAFMEQVDSDGKPIGVMPKVMLVPPALSALSTQLTRSLEMRDPTSNVKYPVNNPHQGKFRTEVSPYLSNQHYEGASQKAWYLLADPEDLPVIEVAFLNGQESPVIETAEADFNVLGVRMRGYHDFGCALQDPRGGIKCKGEA
jgi:hypothetical protein